MWMKRTRQENLHKFTASKHVVYHLSIHCQTLQDGDVELHFELKCREDRVQHLL